MLFWTKAQWEFVNCSISPCAGVRRGSITALLNGWCRGRLERMDLMAGMDFIHFLHLHSDTSMWLKWKSVKSLYHDLRQPCRSFLERHLRHLPETLWMSEQMARAISFTYWWGVEEHWSLFARDAESGANFIWIQVTPLNLCILYLMYTTWRSKKKASEAACFYDTNSTNSNSSGVVNVYHQLFNLHCQKFLPFY